MPDKAKAQEAKARGNAAFQAQKFDEAIQAFTEAIGHDPSDHVFYSNRSGAFASSQKFEAAFEDAKKCVEIKPDWPKGYSRKGLAEFNLGDLDAAEASYQKGLQLAPADAALLEGQKNVKQAKVQREKMQGAMGGGEEFRDTLMLLMQQHPKVKEWAKEPEFMQLFTQVLSAPPAQMQMVMLQVAQKDPRFQELLIDAINLQGAVKQQKAEPFAPAQAAKPKPKPVPVDLRTQSQKDADVFKAKANDLYKKRSFDEAIAQYDEAIKVEPNDMVYHTNKAAVLMEKKEYDACLELCDGLLERRYEMNGALEGGASFEKVAKVYMRKGACFMKQDKFEDALSMYNKAITEDNNKNTRNALREAERCRDKSISEAYLDPAKADAHREAGNEHFKAGRNADAKVEYDEAIKRNPKDAKLYSNRAAALTRLGASPDALRDLEKCLELDPTFVKAYSRKGACHYQMKEYHKSLQAYQKGLDLDPNNEECKNGRAAVMQKIQSQQSEKGDQEQLAHAMADPEIQQILKDPQINIVLQDMQENPKSINNYMKDPKIAEAINKLIAAGVMKVG